MRPKHFLLCPPARHEDRQRIGLVVINPGPGSIELPCSKCGIQTIVGPKQKEVNDATHDTIILCWECSFRDPLIRLQIQKRNIKNLGGTGSDYLIDEKKTRAFGDRVRKEESGN